tara:strand:- start:11023 stop:11589 length:567 start_codon:yes stop_codon:yes gene_type:complete
MLKILNKESARFNTILDIGSGIKNWSYLFPQDANYQTVDLREDLGATHVGDFFKLNFPLKYNLVIGTEIIEHLPNPNHFFERSNKLLEENGLLLISFPFLFKIHPDPNDYYRFTLQGIEEQSKDYFEIVDSIHHGNKTQLIWETLVDGKLLYPFKLLNYLFAKIDYSNKHFPLGYVVVLKKKGIKVPK